MKAFGSKRAKPKTMRGATTLGLASLLLASGLIGRAAFGQTRPSDATDTTVASRMDGQYWDRGRWIAFHRLAPNTKESAFWVQLDFGGRFAPILAQYDRDAILGIDPEGGTELDLDALERRWNVVVVRPLMAGAGLYLVRDASEGDGLALAARLSSEVRAGQLRSATPNLYLAHSRRTVVPDDPRYAGQWYFDNLELGEAWALEMGDPSTTIVVVDNGCDLLHPDLTGKLDPGRDVIDQDDDPSFVPGQPGNEHGTACAGLVGAETNNGIGIAGACPGCRVRCVRLLSADGAPVPVSADVDAFDFALEVGAAVVSNSWGFSQAMPVPSPLAAAIQTVFEEGRDGRGAVVVFAAGNDDREIGADELLAVPGVLGVGAINNYDEKTSFTNYGDSVDIVAPAGTITTDLSGPDGADSSDYTSSFGGTSSACPVVAGVAGLLASAGPDWSAAQLVETIRATARPAPYANPDAAGHDPVYGYGIIDPGAGLTVVLGIDDGAESSDGGCDCSVQPVPAGTVAPLVGLIWARRRRRRRPRRAAGAPRGARQIRRHRS